MDPIPVIILNWNGKKFLSECLNAIQDQSYRNVSPVLVDNGSCDGSVDYVRDNFPKVQIIPLKKNIGFCAGNNVALRPVKSKYVALLNNDTVPQKEWINSLVKALEQHSEAGFAASKMLFFNDPSTLDRAGDSYTVTGAGSLRGRGRQALQYNRREWVFGACAGAALYRTQMLKDIGLFDEDFFLLNEDVDLSFRAQLMGYKCLYVPESVTLHHVSGSISCDSHTSVYYGHRNLEWVYLKNMPLRLIYKTLLPHLIYDIAAFFFFLLNGRGITFIKAKRDALKGVGKILKKRRQIQKNKRVDDDYIWSLFEKKIIPDRLHMILMKIKRP